MNNTKHKQQGIALIFVLLILVVVSLLGVGGAQLAMMGEKGARNERDTQISRQYAEAALIDAEFDIRGPNTNGSKRMDTFSTLSNFIDDCGTSGSARGLCAESFVGKPIWLKVDFLNTSDTAPSAKIGTFTGRTVTNVGIGIQPALAPRYIVEPVPDMTTGVERGLGVKKKILYRVTSMGFGPRADIQTVMQMVFRKE